MNKKSLFSIIVFFICSNTFWANNNLYDSIKPLHTSLNKPVLFDFYFSISGGYMQTGIGHMLTANHHYSRLNNVFLEIGIGSEMYKSDHFRINNSLKYKYDRSYFESTLPTKHGLSTHWLSFDVNTNYSLFCFGITSNIYIYSHYKNNDCFKYDGFYRNCFNPINLQLYGGFSMRFTKVKIEALMGTYITPYFNLKKLAYHNLSSPNLDGCFFKFNFGYYFFTTGKRIKSFKTI